MKITIYHNVARECRYCGVPVTRAPEPLRYEGWVDPEQAWLADVPGTTEDKAREEYHGIADRRVRLGLVLSEIGEKNKITVTDDEVSRAVIERARQMPGREKEVWDYYRNNANALAQLRAPIFEDKVVDFLLELANVTDTKVSKEELYKDEDEKSVA